MVVCNHSTFTIPSKMSIEGFTTKELSDIGEMCDSKCSAVTALPKSSSGHEPLNVSQQIHMCATAVKGVSNFEFATFFLLNYSLRHFVVKI